MRLFLFQSTLGPALLLFIFFQVCKAAQASGICVIPANFPTPQGKTNFTLCYANINATTLDEHTNSGCFDHSAKSKELNYTTLTLQGCEILCGRGRQIWSRNDVFSRLSLLVLPTVVLLGDLGFPPLGWSIYLIAPIQAIGNPIGSLESLSIRFTTQRSHRRIARRLLHGMSGLNLENLDFYKSLATIFSAYEEFGWQDVAGSLYLGGTISIPAQRIITRASYNLSLSRISTTDKAMIAIVVLVYSLVIAIYKTISQVDRSKIRVHNEIAHTIAVVCILFIGIPQVWFSARIGTFTTDVGAVHILENMRHELDRLPGSNYQTVGDQVAHGSAGSDQIIDSQTAHVQASNRQHKSPPEGKREMTNDSAIELRAPSSFPELGIGTCINSGNFFSRCPLERSWPQSSLPSRVQWGGNSGSFTGISGSWRGCHRMIDDPSAPSYSQLLIVSFLFVIVGAGLMAYFVSATNNSVNDPVGIGCRSLSWITVMGIWIGSYAADRLYRGWVSSRSPSQSPYRKLKRLWRFSIVKNAFTATAVVLAVMMVQWGVWNNCWCRSSFRNIVNLFGYTPDQWMRAKGFWCGFPAGGLAVNGALIFWVEFAEWDTSKRWSWTWWLPRCVPSFTRQTGSICKNKEEMDIEHVFCGERGGQAISVPETSVAKAHGNETEQMELGPRRLEGDSRTPLLLREAHSGIP